MKKASPRMATGIPRKYDCAELVTLAQSITPVEGHARIPGDVKCAMVKYVVIGIPRRLNPKQAYLTGVIKLALVS